MSAAKGVARVRHTLAIVVPGADDFELLITLLVAERNVLADQVKVRAVAALRKAGILFPAGTRLDYRGCTATG